MTKSLDSNPSIFSPKGRRSKTMPNTLETWSQLGPVMASLVVAWTYANKAIRHFLFHPYNYIKFPESTSERLQRCELFTTIQNYLSVKAKRFKAKSINNNQSLALSIDDNEEVLDEFEGAKLWWSSRVIVPRNTTISMHPRDDKRYLELKFHQKHRELVTGPYIKHVLEEGKAVMTRNRKRKLFMNTPSSNGDHRRANLWNHVAFKHPSTFDTLAMDPSKKMEIMNDLLKFQQGKEYYERIGKTWQRGYLLYGPPGTGKSTMIAAMANFLNYNVYDVELTTVNDNTELKKLLIGTSEKSIIVIEDIDCSLDLTGQRKTKKQKKYTEEIGNPANKMLKGEEESHETKVTLSGLLNFIDGLWSACKGERIIVFTTNFVEKLDPALIRRGRMDKRIQMSYCCFESFKVLARNYLGIESHPLFTRVKQLLKETEMTPADVAENLMSMADHENQEACLEGLIEALEKAKEDARKKSEEEEKAAIAEATAARAMAEEEGQRTLSKEEQENGRRGCAEEVKANGVL